MSGGILSRLPDLRGVTQIGASIQSGAGGLASAFGAISQEQPGSPLASVSGALGGLNVKLSVDVSGLTGRFPAALDTMRAAVAPASVDFVKSIETAYKDAGAFLDNSALARELAGGKSLQEVALRVIEGILGEFDQRLEVLAKNLIDPKALKTVTGAFEQLSRFQADFNAHRADFLPFLSRNLLGVAPDVLRAPLEHVDQALGVLAALDPAAVQAALGAPGEALATAFRDLYTAVAGMDAADPNAYVQINGRLDALDSAVPLLRDAALQLYAALQSAIDAHAWDSIFSAHRSLLEAVSFDASLSVDEVVHEIVVILDGVFARLQTVFGPADLVERIQELSADIQDLFANSPLGEVRRAIRDFLGQIRHAIESVPTEEIQEAVQSILERVRQEIDALGITEIGDTIETGFRKVEAFIKETINEALGVEVRTAIQDLLDDLQTLPIKTLVDDLNQVIARLHELILEIETALQGAFDKLSEVAAELDKLSFEPVGDAVVGEINELKGRLESINPNALSEAEKLAIKAALAVVQAIDLEGFIETNVKAGFRSAKDTLLGLLDQVSAILDTVRERIDGFDPEQLMGGITGALNEAQQAVNGLNARVLMQPFYERLDEFRGRLDAVSPGALLTPLEEPFRAVRSAVDQLDPDRLVEPLRSLYTRIDGLIDQVDVTPLFDELDRRQKELFAGARDAILLALDGLSLPEPLAGFLAALRPALEAMIDAIFQDLNTESIGLDLSARFRLSSLFEPLDQAFDALVRMLESVPEAELRDTVNTIRTAVGVGLAAVDPQHILDTLRAGQGRLASVSPRLLLDMPLGLPSVKAAFEARVEGAPVSVQASVTATLARFDAATALTRDALSPLIKAHDALEDSLRRRIDALDTSGVDEAYGRLRQSLGRVVPDFLRGALPLTHAEIMAGIRSLRPSLRVGPVDALFERFLAHLRPMQATLEPAIDGFFRTLRDVLMLLNPLSLKDAVADIYTAIRHKVQVLDPARLSAGLHKAIFDPVVNALRAIDPATLKVRLDAAFQSALSALTTNVKAILEQIGAALDQQLQSLQDAVESVVDRIGAAVRSAAETFEDLIERVEHLVFVEILERLRRSIEALGVGFDKELNRVRSAFDEMLNAIPLGGGAGVSVSVSR